MPNIKDKIAKLLALAESPNEHEAKAALLKARALMAAHKLNEKDIQNIPGQKALIRRTIGITFTELSTPWVLTIAQAVARHYCCAAYQSVSAFHFGGFHGSDFYARDFPEDPENSTCGNFTHSLTGICQIHKVFVVEDDAACEFFLEMQASWRWRSEGPH